MKSTNFRINFRKFFQFVSLLNVEPFMFFMVVFVNIKKVPINQLIQDKLCQFKYKLDDQYCLELPTLNTDDDKKHMKSIILADLAQYSMYMTIISAIPTILSSLFIGSWTDKYQGAKKSLMILATVAGLIESLIIFANIYFNDQSPGYVLLSSLPSCFVGGSTALYTIFWSYIASTTPPKQRAIRMLIGEVVLFSAAPTGTYIGGLILKQKPFLKHGQLHNFSLICIVGLTANFIALLWALIRVNEKRDLRLFRTRFQENTVDVQTNEPEVCAKQKQFNDHKHIHPLKLLFSLDNIKDMIRTCCKRRKNHVRLQIWLLFLAMIFYIITHSANHVFLLSFVERVYNWDSSTYSNATSIGDIIIALSTMILAPILIKVFKLRDMTLAMIGLSTYFIKNMILGLVLSPNGFYISLLAGSMGSVTSVSIRTHVSKIVEPKELGKVFSLMSAIDSVAPLLASAVFTNIFKATIDTMPGISFIIIGGLLLIPFYVTFWIDLYTVLPDLNNNNNNNNNVKEEIDINSDENCINNIKFDAKM